MAPSGTVFHVELRQFPNATRAFNLTRDQLDARIVRPWAQGQAIELDDRRWLPGRAKLAIYEGRELASEEMGMGRGWANVTRAGEDVTERLLAEARRALATPPALTGLKEELLVRCARGPIALHDVPELTSELLPSGRASERLALAEQAAWELLHEGKVTLLRGSAPLARAEWQATLLSWSAWAQATGDPVSLAAG